MAAVFQLDVLAASVPFFQGPADYKIGNIVFVADAHNLFQYFV